METLTNKPPRYGFVPAEVMEFFEGGYRARARGRRRARASSARGTTMETRGRTMENGVGARGGIARTRDG